ncbi:hypothetical protein KQI68_03140 [Peptoniphilus sp. MSJ-1]|uniref:Uncharacterized protein n=1 Tax=Peptoniphilus ovalis TaxID=2841503 RepID=A0ABS6FF68_9FIRM|nr:hypothetical protein [Peptoniphilus ovalis]MBU5668829.1 hypothetical protein [Peptoniphilus ovalis]
MKFITENDLRNIYFENPFTFYEIKENTRLTPGARQFLIDFKIEFDKNKKVDNKTNKKINECFENKSCKDINFAINLKEFAYSIKKLDENFAEKLNDYSNRFYKNEKIKCEIRFREIDLKKIFLEMNLDDKNLELVLKVIKFQELIKDKYTRDNEEIKLILNMINLWAIRKIEDGDKN